MTQRVQEQSPNLRLHGPVDDAMLCDFHSRLDAMEGGEELMLELFTLGGDAEVARRIAEEIRLEFRRGRKASFLGATAVFSVGISIMAAFPRDDRFLTADCVLLVHEHRLQKAPERSEPLVSSAQVLRETNGELDMGVRPERHTFADLAAGSRSSCDEIVKRARAGWYVSAYEALELQLVRGLV